MSHFFKDVGDFIAEPFRDVYGLVTNDPKRNSLGDDYNANFGPDNAFSRTVSDVTKPLVGWTGADPGKAFQTAPWEEQWSKPGQAFFDQINYTNKALPSFAQPIAEPIEALGVSAFNPFLGAAFHTAYQGGQQQAEQKGFDWGQLGKDAAINFGTATVASGASKLLQNANVATASTPAYGNQTSQLSSAFKSATDPFTSPAVNFAPTTTASNLATNSANALNAVGAVPASVSAVDSFNPQLIGSSQSVTPQANALASSGQNIGDVAYQQGLQHASSLVNNTLTATLNPQNTQPIQGSLDSFSPSSISTGPQSQWGDVLNAFGGGEVNTANPNGPRIDETAFNNSVNRLSANTYLQDNQARDLSLPAGQYQASLNTPYAHQLNDIQSGTNQAYLDLLNETNNANKYYGIIDTNPGLTSDQLNTYLADPSSGVLGNFTVPSDAAAMLAGIRPLGPMNTSLL